jgi:hypothetical protein
MPIPLKQPTTATPRGLITPRTIGIFCRRRTAYSPVAGPGPVTSCGSSDDARSAFLRSTPFFIIGVCDCRRSSGGDRSSRGHRGPAQGFYRRLQGSRDDRRLPGDRQGHGPATVAQARRRPAPGWQIRFDRTDHGRGNRQRIRRPRGSADVKGSRGRTVSRSQRRVANLVSARHQGAVSSGRQAASRAIAPADARV